MSSLATLKTQPIPKEPWEALFLLREPTQLKSELRNRYAQSSKQISNVNFELKNLVAYAHQFYDQERVHIGGLSKAVEQGNKKFASWISKCGGRLKMSVDQTVDLVVVEDHNLEEIIEKFVKWRNLVLQGKNPQSALNAITEEQDPPPQSKQALSKREQLLLGGTVSQAKPSTNDVKYKQLSLQFNNMSVENKTRMNLRSKNRLASTIQNLNEQIAELMESLKGESDKTQKDFNLLYHLLKNPAILVSEFDPMYKILMRSYSFTKHFIIDKKAVQDIALMRDEQVNQIFCFTPNSNSKYISSKMANAIHAFPLKNTSRAATTPPTVMVPHFRQDAPRHSVCFLDNEEYGQTMKYKAKQAQDYEKHIEKLKKKLPESYDIKTPVPNDRHDYCSVCVKRFGDYKSHIRGEEHKRAVNEDKLYKDIDLLIDVINDDLEQKKLLKQTQDANLTEIEEEVSDVLTQNNRFNQSQELTQRLGAMSTEITANSKVQFLPSANFRNLNLKQTRITPLFKMPKQPSKFVVSEEMNKLGEVKLGSKRTRAYKDQEDKIIMEKNFDYTRQINDLKKHDKMTIQQIENEKKLLGRADSGFSLPIVKQKVAEKQEQ